MGTGFRVFLQRDLPSNDLIESYKELPADTVADSMNRLTCKENVFPLIHKEFPMKKYLIKALAIVICAAALFTAPEASAADYPKKNITMIVPFSAGGSADIGARRLAQYLEKELGVSVIIDNAVGASGWVGWNKLMKAKPDGYTLALFTLAYVDGYINPEMKRKQNLTDVTPIANHVLDTTAWAVLPDSPYKDAKQLLEFAKANPGKVKVATSGVLTQHHILLIELERLGYKMEPVHTNGVADIMTMVLGGHVDVASLGAGNIYKLAQEGSLRALATIAPERSRFLPDTPTLKENTGFALEAYAARGYAGPAKMDPSIVKILADAFDKAMNNPDHVKDMENMGLDVAFLNSEDYLSFLKKIEKEHKEALGW